MKIERIAFTMYPVQDMGRARKFYEDDLGLQVSANWDDKWVEYEVGGGVFAITDSLPNSRPAANAGGSIAFEVDDVDGLTQKLRSRGVRILHEPFSTPVCRMSAVMDPEGNAVMLHHVTD